MLGVFSNILDKTRLRCAKSVGCRNMLSMKDASEMLFDCISSKLCVSLCTVLNSLPDLLSPIRSILSKRASNLDSSDAMR